MKLRHNPASPYVRKVMVVAHELGLFRVGVGVIDQGLIALMDHVGRHAHVQRTEVSRRA